ncbi:MAG: hypothetical protein WCI01_11410, partial [Chlorobiaceae bacterium]
KGEGSRISTGIILTGHYCKQRNRIPRNRNQNGLTISSEQAKAAGSFRARHVQLWQLLYSRNGIEGRLKVPR